MDLCSICNSVLIDNYCTECQEFDFSDKTNRNEETK